MSHPCAQCGTSTSSRFCSPQCEERSHTAEVESALLNCAEENEELRAIVRSSIAALNDVGKILGVGETPVARTLWDRFERLRAPAPDMDRSVNE